jgi:hypothetical protein
LNFNKLMNIVFTRPKIIVIAYTNYVNAMFVFRLSPCVYACGLISWLQSTHVSINLFDRQMFVVQARHVYCCCFLSLKLLFYLWFLYCFFWHCFCLFACFWFWFLFIGFHNLFHVDKCLSHINLCSVSFL